MSLSQEKILDIFHETHALLEGHFQLTSGLHSPQYFQCAKVLQYPRYAELFCHSITEYFKDAAVNAVVAPALGGIVVGQEVGRQLAGGQSDQVVRTMFTERRDGAIHLRRGFKVAKGERVLVCEDVITTGGSVNEVIRIVRSEGADVIGVGCVVDRSGGKVKFDVPAQFAVLQMDVITYVQRECPLCRQGVPVEKPGSRER